MNIVKSILHRKKKVIKIYKTEIAKKTDYEQIRKILWKSFDPAQPYEKFEMDEWFSDYSHYRSLIVREGDKIVSHMAIRHYENSIRGTNLPLNGVSWVSTDPLYRHKGLVRKLTHFGFKDMKNRGEVISTLHPFEMSFYEKFGYATAETIDRYQISASNFRKIPLANGITIRELTDKKDAEILDNLQRTMTRFGSMVFFRLCELEELIEKPNCYLIEDNKEPIGWVKFFLYPQGMRTLLVTNYYAYENDEALQAIVHLMSIFAEQHDITTEFHSTGLPCIWEGIPEIPIREFIKDRFALKVQRVGGFMIRIIDFQKYCELIEIPLTATEPVILRIEDRMCDWNNGNWLLTPIDGKLQVSIIDKKPDLIVNDLLLSKIVGGLTPATTLREVGEINCSQETAKNLATIFPRESFYVWNRDL